MPTKRSRFLQSFKFFEKFFDNFWPSKISIVNPHSWSVRLTSILWIFCIFKICVYASKYNLTWNFSTNKKNSCDPVAYHYYQKNTVFFYLYVYFKFQKLVNFVFLMLSHWTLQHLGTYWYLNIHSIYFLVSHHGLVTEPYRLESAKHVLENFKSHYLYVSHSSYI